MSFNETDSSTNNSYILSGEINGPAYAAALSVELVLAFIPNLFIIVYTLCHPTILKQPSMIFLTGLAVINLLSTVLYIPFTIVTAAAGEWIIGTTNKQRDGMCNFVGFIVSYTGGVSTYILTIISFDRFLLIVKPFLYQRYMKPWVAFVLLVTVSVFVALQDIVPFLGLGEYHFAPIFASCVADWINQPGYVAFLSTFRTIPIIPIIVTSLWTFCFTRKFIGKEKHHKIAIVRSDTIKRNEKNVYTKRIRNLVGIFGALMIVMVVSFSPYIIVSVVGFVVGFDKIPIPVWPTVLVLFFVNSFATPIVQIHFRRDLQMGLFNGVKKIKGMCRTMKIQDKEEASKTSDRFQSTSSSRPV